jgi:hypothetical protein
LIFSETFEELLGELEGMYYEIYWSHEKSLPACFNDPTEQALADLEVFAILLCEDDMIIPKGILKKMFAKNYPIIALDYPFKADGDSTMLHDPQGDVYWSGTGFLLVAADILRQMEKPIWRTDTAWDTFIGKDVLYFWPRKLNKIAYGLHDVNFGMTLYSAGLPIKTMVKTAGQRKLVRLGEKTTNNGAHEIKKLTKVGRDLVIKTIDPVAIDKFRGAMNRVKTVEIMDHIPDWITYVDGRAVLKEGEYETV